MNYCLPKEGKGRKILQKVKVDCSFPHSRTWLSMGRTRQDAEGAVLGKVMVPENAKQAGITEAGKESRWDV